MVKKKIVSYCMVVRWFIYFFENAIFEEDSSEECDAECRDERKDEAAMKCIL